MELKTKFNIGDKVWFALEVYGEYELCSSCGAHRVAGPAYESAQDEIVHLSAATGSWGSEIIYSFDDGADLTEEECFDTKEEAEVRVEHLKSLDALEKGREEFPDAEPVA